MHNHIGCICLIFLHCVSLNVPSNCLHKKMHNYIGCICLIFLYCAFSNVSLIFFLQIARPSTGKIALVAFIQLFSTMHYQMSLQSVRLRACKVALLALFGFSPVCGLRWLFKLPFTEVAYSHWLHLFDLCPTLIVFLNVNWLCFGEILTLDVWGTY